MVIDNRQAVNYPSGVRGVARLHVADASISPEAPSVTTNPMVVMLAERASRWPKSSKQRRVRHAILERLKKTVMVWLAAYPSVLLVISLVGDVFTNWPLPLRVLGATAIIVPIVANITDPAVKAAVTAIERVWRRRSSRSAP